MVLMEAKKSCKLTSVSISIFWPSRAPVGRRCGGQPSIIGPRLINEEGLTQQRERESVRGVEGVEGLEENEEIQQRRRIRVEERK